MLFARLIALLGLLVLPSIHYAQWTTPRPIDSTNTRYQEGPLIAVSKAGTITVVCYEFPGNQLIAYRSTDNGSRFSRHPLARPLAPNYTLWNPYGFAYDSSDVLWLLWAWDYIIDPLPVDYFLVLSKSTDFGATFTDVLKLRRGLRIRPSRMFIDSQNNIHLLRDSVAGGRKVVYTRLHATSPGVRFDAILPDPVNFVGGEIADFAVADSFVHYAQMVTRYGGGEYPQTIEYARSANRGISFSALQPVDTISYPRQTYPRLLAFQNAHILLAYVSQNSPDGNKKRAVISDDNGLTFGSPFVFGTRQPSGTGTLGARDKYTYSFHSAAITTSLFGMHYEQYENPTQMPTDSIYIPEFASGDIVIGEKNQKYIVLQRIISTQQQPPFLYFSSKDIPTSVANEENILLQRLLLQAFPNPFNPSTTIKFSVGTYGHTSLRVFDLLGRKVATLVNEEVLPGSYERVFNAEKLASGIYYCRLVADGQSVARKMLLLR